MWMVAAYTDGLTVQVVWLGLRVGGHQALSLHFNMSPIYKIYYDNFTIIFQ